MVSSVVCSGLFCSCGYAYVYIQQAIKLGHLGSGMQALGQESQSAFQTIRKSGRRQANSYIRENERSGNISRKLGSRIPEGNERSDTSVELKVSGLPE
jgi:hypothetical protein